MKIAVTTPTGHIGSKVADLLLKAGAEVVLLARDPTKVRDLVRRGAQLRQGALGDAYYLIRATHGVDALFWVTPPNFTTKDVRGFQNQVGHAAAQAIRENRIPRVVNISSAGAQLASGAGPVSGLHEVEMLLDEVAPNITHLRCGFFFENYLYQLDHIRRDSCVYMPISGSRRFPMIATADIAQAAAKRLLDAKWTGRNILGLHGPADLSLDEAAAEISKGVGRLVRYVKAPEDELRNAMRAMGASDNFIDTMLEMYRAVESGLMVPAEPRTPETTTPTTLEEFAREVVAPLLAEPVHA